jgi:S-adenosylmethionine synthetase
VFDCTPGGIIMALDLLKPIYQETASYGHFGRDEFAWEKTDRVQALRERLK